MITEIDGKLIANDIKESVKAEINSIMTNGYRKPKLVIITVGDDEASKVYVRNKKKACEQCDIDFLNVKFDKDVSKDDVVKYIAEANKDTGIDGILVQLPVPPHLKGIEEHISFSKDVDGLSKTQLEYYNIEPCTPKGIMTLFDRYNIDLQGKHVVILGRSNIVGKPLINMCLSRNATVTSCNSYTQNLKNITRDADIIISAIGKPKMIDYKFITVKCKCIIDVGINRDENNKLCGDVDHETVLGFWRCIDDCTSEESQSQRYITPVPRRGWTYDCSIFNAKYITML